MITLELLQSVKQHCKQTKCTECPVLDGNTCGLALKTGMTPIMWPIGEAAPTIQKEAREQPATRGNLIDEVRPLEESITRLTSRIKKLEQYKDQHELETMEQGFKEIKPFVEQCAMDLRIVKLEAETTRLSKLIGEPTLESTGCVWEVNEHGQCNPKHVQYLGVRIALRTVRSFRVCPFCGKPIANLIHKI
jgi:hypothetical protein